MIWMVDSYKEDHSSRGNSHPNKTVHTPIHKRFLFTTLHRLENLHLTFTGFNLFVQRPATSAIEPVNITPRVFMGSFFICRPWLLIFYRHTRQFYPYNCKNRKFLNRCCMVYGSKIHNVVAGTYIRSWSIDVKH